ncbi:glycosyltransferase family 4 protein [Pseudooceanicola algae]|uniref:D-inositol-3-phosphate glycosyltransferase n=1 Tax=Pseudooceanicola algae TaxID=1537215 RepID=A0A418SF83_9RHOB|nr:glycosyltransferase family 4 protein [Pseudooceanicola algae]QPM89256.1 D-inositol-3-phosphate glycosyltransferase [Pseudooceanicola algae]
MPELFVTNFNRNFTGVSATAAGVIRQQQAAYDLALIGHPLPGCPTPIGRDEARRLSRRVPATRPFAIWHVRRNPEMRAALWARDVLRLPIKIVFTSAAQRYHSALPRWLIARMDAVIATTDKAADFVPHVRAVVHHGVDCTRYTPAPDRAAAWAATGYPGTRGIATIGRIRPEKGTDLTVETLIRTLPGTPDTTALVLGRAKSGDQAFLDGLKEKIAAAGLTDRILFPGEIPADDLPALLRALSLVVQLPRYEGYGMAPLEALASATPILASEAGFFREFTQGGRNGLVVPLDDVAAATEALKAMLSDADKLGAMSQHARQDAEKLFNITGEAAGINAVYERLWAEDTP